MLAFLLAWHAMEFFVLFLLFVLNGVFSMSEMAVVSSRKARLQQLFDEGHAGAGAALELANDPSHFLSTIQVGITIIGITSGAFGEARLSAQVTEWLAQWPVLAPHAHVIAVTLVIAGITVGSTDLILAGFGASTGAGKFGVLAKSP